MIYQLLNRPAVIEDINAIILNFNKENAILSLGRLQQARNYISNFPFAFQIKYKNVRTVLLEQFPYHLHYIIEEEKAQISVLAIIHTHRMPTDYTNR
jgi:plasmid stabilization system protein ParE